MTVQAHLFGSAGRTDAAEVLAELEVDYTPVAVAVQLLLVLQDHGLIGHNCMRALDPAAGSGCWGRAMRAVLGPVPDIVGVEPRASEVANIRAAYNLAYSLDLPGFLGQHAEFKCGGFDLIATNPPFSAFENFWPATLRSTGLAAPGSVVAFYGLSQWGQSAQAMANLRGWWPSLQLRCGGRIAHREDGKVDAREYSLWVWDTTDHPRRGRPRWSTEQLPELPTEMRRWTPAAVPGTYVVDPALVAELRRRYL